MSQSWATKQPHVNPTWVLTETTITALNSMWEAHYFTLVTLLGHCKKPGRQGVLSAPIFLGLPERSSNSPSVTQPYVWQSQDLNPGCLVPGPALTSWVETSLSHLCCGITNVQGPRKLWFKDQNSFALDTEDGQSPRKPPRSLLGTTNLTNLAFE